jgi:hypothetical protein
LVGELPFVRLFFGAGLGAASVLGEAVVEACGRPGTEGTTGSTIPGTSRSDSAPLRGRFRSPLRPKGQRDMAATGDAGRRVVVVVVVVSLVVRQAAA